jgi:hypothetical protein
VAQACTDGVDTQPSPLRRAGDPGALPAQQGPHPGHQFVALERLGQVVVRAGFQAIDAVVQCVAGGE